MRCVIALASVLAGCGQLPPLTCEPSTPPPVRACDVPREADASAVTDVHTFRTIASIAACERGLRCDDTLTQPFCHPRYAEWVAADFGAVEVANFDVEAGRACVRSLAEDRCSSNVDLECFMVSIGGFIACSDPRSVSPVDRPDLCYPFAAGVSCDDPDGCLLGNVCVDHACRVPVREGGACIEQSECAAGLICRAGGTCGLARVGEPCEPADCVGGAICQGEGTYGSTRCIAVCGAPFRPRGHIGCACARDDECPGDVSVCRGGVCIARPFFGDACTHDGPLCYGSECDGTTCVHYAAGHGPCSGDADCAPGLRCSPWDIFGGTPRTCF
jgi:hypothetical protein